MEKQNEQSLTVKIPENLYKRLKFYSGMESKEIKAIVIQSLETTLDKITIKSSIDAFIKDIDDSFI